MKIIKLKTFIKLEDLIEFINENKIQRADIQHMDIVYGVTDMCSLSYWEYQAGGIVTSPTLGLIGESGPEVVFPFNLETK